MFHYTPDFTDAAIRRFISKVGLEHITDLFSIRLADQVGTNNTQHIDRLVELKKRIEKEVESQHAFTIKDLNVNGNDLISMGIPKGPVIGIILNELFETVLDDPTCNNKEMLLDIGKKFYEQRIQS